MLFFGVFALGGFLALFGIGKLVWETARIHFSWSTVPATIVQSEMRTERGKYILDVRYQYEFEGKTFAGTRFKPNGNRFDGTAAARKAEQRFRSDTVLPCYVNPSAPEESYLERGSLAQGFLLLIPLVFISVGVGGIILMNRKERPRALSERHNPKAGLWGLRIFGLVFMLVGGGFIYGIGINPWLAARAAENWQEVPCKITVSRVDSHRTSKGGTSYSLEILYEYMVNGQPYSCDRFNFSPATSGGRSSSAEASRQYPVGRQTVCYVNPADPTDAVLLKEGGLSWFALIPGFFFLVGLLIFANAGKATGASRKSGLPVGSTPETQSGTIGGLRGVIGDTGGPTELTRSNSPMGLFIGLLIVGLIWNGIIWGIFLLADPPTGAKVFLSIFALIGLGIFAGAFYQFLALFNPVPRVEASASAVRLGESIEIRFNFSGKIHRITELRLTLKAEEVATYRRGTNTATDRNVFHFEKLLETRDHALMRTGAIMLSIPGDLMHSFDAANNKIIWTLTLHGDVPRWPDVEVSFPITVLPKRQEDSLS